MHANESNVAVMRSIFGMLLIVVTLLVMGAGCQTSDKPDARRERVDGGYTLRDECDAPSMNCHNACFQRKASATCGGCCRDQRFLCDTQQPHSFDSCATAP